LVQIGATYQSVTPIHISYPNQKTEYQIEIPSPTNSSFTYMHIAGGHGDGFNFVYPNNNMVYLTNDYFNSTPNQINYAHIGYVPITIPFSMSDTIITGQLVNGNYWKEIVQNGHRLGYTNVSIAQKEAFDHALLSFRINGTLLTNITTLSPIQYIIQRCRAFTNDSGAVAFLNVPSLIIPVGWIKHAHVDSLMSMLGSTDTCGCIQSLNSSTYPIGPAQKSGYAALFLDSYIHQNEIRLNGSHCPTATPEQIADLKKWYKKYGRKQRY
jgi:hypothetical protein